MILQVCETRLYWRGSLMCMPPPTFESPPSLRPTVCSSHDPSRCPFHKYTASACGLASFPRKRESRGRAPWGLDARLRGHDILLAQDLRNGHLASFDDALWTEILGAIVTPEGKVDYEILARHRALLTAFVAQL